MKKLNIIFFTHFFICFLIFCVYNLASAATSHHHSPSNLSSGKIKKPSSTVSSNPAAVNATAGTGNLQRYLEKNGYMPKLCGIDFDGAWIADVNDLFSGIVPNGNKWTGNSLFLFSVTLDTEKLMNWQGGKFNIQLLQFNGGNTNTSAGSVQGYNSLPGPPPLNRTELYQLWYRQELLDKKLVVRIGKVVPTYDFNNVIQPVPLDKKNISIPAVTSLIYTPIFVNTSMLGVMPGYYNSAYGITINILPTNFWYLSLGVYDGNLAQGTQLGLTGPHFNGSYFHIGETGLTWLIGKNELPGSFAMGAWHQTGLIVGGPTLFERGASGYYLFGSQRIWYQNPGIDSTGISIFYQYGANNSDALPMTRYIGAGLTAFGPLPCRLDDSMGIGAALSWLNRKTFNQKTEFMLQAYYQAEILKNILFVEPALSYIPRPGASPTHHAAWAGTMRAILLF